MRGQKPVSEAYKERRCVVFLLRASYLVGFLFDALAGYRLSIPVYKSAMPIFRALWHHTLSPKGISLSSLISTFTTAAMPWTPKDSTATTAAAMMWGWTFLLLWGSSGLTSNAWLGIVIRLIIVPLFGSALWLSRGLSVD
ncbi:hypothetical protein Pelo_5627 [Pelomyxa schiedti]|nr:hypothetical protein Pelo_5627 [Pelomyxa schiedti]